MPDDPRVDPLPLETAAAKALHESAGRLRSASVTALFAQDPDRCDRLRREACGLELDFSRQRLDERALAQLLALGHSAKLPGAMTALLAGEEVNPTEGRPALHSALRAPTGANSEVDSARDAMRGWCERIRSGALEGFDGQTITDVVNIGIGGSDLGPRLVADALGAPGRIPRAHFVANVDPQDLWRCLSGLVPGRTLFIICSKSFRTEETRVNAEAARGWLQAAGAGEDSLSRHFLAISSNLEAAGEFGIPESNCLPMWDWVGGRYSLWSAVGLSAAMTLGWETFEALLAGAHAMDRHAAEAPPEDNLPMLAALIDCWNSHFLGAENLAVLPYAQRLARLPDYLQQLVMESNGKRVTLDGSPLPYHSAPILWGSAGTIGQHSFHQLLHQGTRLSALELVLPLAGDDDGDAAQHARLVAHGLAQASVFAGGRSEDEAKQALLDRGAARSEAERLAPHLAMPGNRPLNLVSFHRLTPQALGAYLALWEHRTYLGACLLGINAFDQWGVELGKVVSGRIQEAMAAPGKAMELDPATQRLLGRWRRAQED